MLSLGYQFALPVDITTKANPCYKPKNTGKNKEACNKIAENRLSTRIRVFQTDDSETILDILI
jgi:hypothetical protein